MHTKTRDEAQRRFWDRTAARYDGIVRLLGARYAAMNERVRRDLRGRGRVLARVGARPNVEVEQADLYDLSRYADASFDAVVCANVLHVLDSPSRALAGMRRVLESGGLLVAPTFCHGETRLSRLISRTMSLVSPFQARQHYTARSLAAQVREAGFTVASVEGLGGALPLVYLRATAG